MAEKYWARATPEFGPLLAHFRERGKWSGNWLALQVGVNPSYLSRMEKGRRNGPSMPIVDALARVICRDAFEWNQLRVAAGLAPKIAQWDATLQGVAEALGKLEGAEREELCTVLRTICRYVGNGRE